VTEDAAPPRELSADEERLCAELNIDKASFLGERIDQSEVVRKDPYFLVAPHRLDPGQTVASQLESLEVQGNLRFGNRMTALANAYLIARALNLPKVIIPSHPLLREEFSIHGVRFSQKGEESEDYQSLVRLRGTFFYRHTLGHLLVEKHPRLLPSRSSLTPCAWFRGFGAANSKSGSR
jgi:hypothetical protein